MAKTRIKTTPTRMQKEALTASAAVVNPSNTRIVTEHVLKKRLCALNNSMLAKEATALQSATIIVQPPKRTNSISSATSTISHTSDGGHSSIESPPPTSSSSSNTPTNSRGPTMDELTENAIKTLNAGLLAKTNALALKNRKVYMITEKCDDSQQGGNGNGAGGASGGSGSATGGAQKRKMYLIMEEKDTEDRGDGQTEKFLKSECSNGTKKLTLFTDTTNGQLPQKIEQILPEILNCIQAKDAAASGGNGASGTGPGSNGGKTRFVTQEVNGKSTAQDNENSKIRLKPDTSDNNERLPLTLPPKKNRTKIITTQIIPVNNHHHQPPTTNSNGEVATAASVMAESKGATNVFSTTNGSCSSSSSKYTRCDKSSATPVIVNATNLMAANGSSNGASKENGNKLTGKTSTPQLHKNINLSTDFLFLMKMLPKLESIAEPHKNYVKACIEDIINQYAPQPFGDQ